MKNFSVYRRACLAFKALLLLQMILMVIPYMNAVLMPYVRIFLVWGWGLLLYGFITGRKPRSSRLLFLLLAFCAAYGVTILLNRTAGFSRNAKDLLYMLMVFLLLFGWDRTETMEETRAERNFLSLELMGITFVLALICLTTFLLGVQYRYVIGDELCAVGIMGGRLWGLYNPNNGGALEALSILLSLGFLCEKPQGRLAVFCRLNLVLQGAALILGHSRTATYGLLAVLALMMLVRLRRKQRRLAVCLAGAVLTVGLGFLADEALFRAGMALAQSLHPTIVAAAETDASMGDNGAETGAADWSETNVEAGTDAKNAADMDAYINEKFSYLEGREGGFFSGRTVLWKAGWQTFLEHPLFGVSREGLYEAVAVHVEDEAWLPDLGGGGLHSIYLTILVSSGAVGGLLYGCLLVLEGRRLLPALLGTKGKGLPQFGVDGFLVLLFLIIELAEARTMYQMRFFFVVFWMYSGYATQAAEYFTAEGGNL